MRFILLTILLAFHLQTQAQKIQSFPEDDTEFVNVLSTYIASNNRADAREISTWIKSNLQMTAGEDFPKIKEIANLMLKKKILLWPQFYNFFKLVQSTGMYTDISKDILSENYDVFIQLIDTESKDANKNFNFYVDYLSSLYKEKSIYSDKIRNWYVDNNYTIKMKDGLPVYVFEKLTLTGVTKMDSLEIAETSGEFYPFTNIWKGDGGRINWHRTSYDPQSVYVTIRSYEIDLSKPELVVDTAILNFEPYVDGQVSGSFTDKLFTTSAAARSFPKFTTFENHNLNISEDISITGRLELEGNAIYATNSSRVEPARLKIFDSEIGKVLDSESSRLRIENLKKIETKKAKVEFAFFNDSTPIFHPACALSYNVETKNLRITRLGTNEAKSPFISSFFKMNIYADQFDWTIGNNYADMNSTYTNAKLPADFESFNYYKEGIDSKYTQHLNVEPITKIAEFCEDIGFRTISIEEVAGLLQVGSYKSIEGLVYRMMQDGFLNYDSEDGMVYVFDKLMLYAAIKKNPEDTDYDNIKLSSVTQGKVGKLLFDKKQLELLGVEDAQIAPVGNIMMVPSSDTVYIGENRTIAFKGRLTSGKFNFYSDSIVYDYDVNAFNLENIDSMLIMVPMEQADSKGNVFYTEINTPIENISGKIYVSDPEQRNKSTKYTKYPYFINTDTSVVRFDFTKYGDKYPDETFNFKISPFTIEKMSTVDTDSIKFEGSFTSDNIFKDMKTEIAVDHNDLTLGVHFSTVENGERLYNGESVLYADVKLNKNGLIAKGRLERNNVSFYFDEMTFLPDSAAGALTGWEGRLVEGMVYPEFKADSAFLSWIPSADSIYVEPEEESELNAYDNRFALNGTFFIRGDEMSEKGEVNIDDNIFVSDEINLFPDEILIRKTPLLISKNGFDIFKSDTSDIKLNTETLVADIYTTKDSISEYLTNKIRTNYNSFEWNIRDTEIDTKDSLGESEKYFELTESKFKGLRLVANQTSFDGIHRVLNLEGISQILVGDSKVIPNEAHLKITDEGTIDVLDNATVIFQSDSSFHELHSAVVEIVNKNEMKGKGKLSIQSDEMDVLKDINMESFSTVSEVVGSKKNADTLYHLEAKGFIDELNPLALSGQLLYKGNVFITSLDKSIRLDGYAKPQFKTIPESDWFHIEQNLDYKNSSFSIDSLKNESGQEIYTGLMLDMYDMRVYPRIIQSKDIPSDRAIYTAKGVMKSVPSSPVILFGEEEAVNKLDDNEPLLKYNDENTKLEARGIFNLTDDISPNSLNLYGTTIYNKDSVAPFSIKSSLALNLYLTDEIESLLNRFMIDNHVEGKYLKVNGNKSLSQDIARLIENDDNQLFVARDMEESGILNLPQNFSYNTVFSDVNLVYDNLEGTFKSIEPVDMLVFAGKPFLQKINAYIEIGPRNDGDFFHIYLTTANDAWIFIRHYKNELSILSSDNNFNDGLFIIKEKNRTLKSGKEIVYRISTVMPTIKDNFVSRMMDFEFQYKKKESQEPETKSQDVEIENHPSTEYKSQEQDAKLLEENIDTLEEDETHTQEVETPAAESKGKKEKKKKSKSKNSPDNPSEE